MRGFNSGNALALDRLTFIRTDGARDALPASVPIAPPSCLLPPLEKRQHHLSVRSCCSTFRVIPPIRADRLILSSRKRTAHSFGPRYTLQSPHSWDLLIHTHCASSISPYSPLCLSHSNHYFHPSPSCTLLLHANPSFLDAAPLTFNLPHLPRNHTQLALHPAPTPPHLSSTDAAARLTRSPLPSPLARPSQPSFPLLSSAPLDVPPARPSSSPRPWPSQPAISGTPATPPRRTPRPRP